MNKRRRQLFNNLRNHTYCRIAPSKIHGTGVFAIRDIPKGVNPFVLTDNQTINHQLTRISEEEFDSLDNGVKKIISDFLSPEDDGSYYVPYLGLNSLDISFYMNHSDNNNIDIIETDTDFLGFKTNKKIKKGQELTINYEDYE